MKPYYIVLDPKAEPVVHAPRAVPVHLHKMFKDELDQMVELGVIVPVNEPKEWINSVVLSKTTNDDGVVTKLRICLDPRDVNKWVKREHNYTKTVHEVLAQLHDAKFFSIIDAKKGYWHVPLDKQSSLLTTLNSPFGRNRFTRLPFGLIVSQDVFQKELDTALEGSEFLQAHVDTRRCQARQQESVNHTCHETPWQRQRSTELPRLSELPDEVLQPAVNSI